LETSKNDFKKEPVNFSNLLHNLIEYFNVLSQEKHITLISHVEPDIVVSGKKDKLEELITSLMSNAMKYISPHKEKKIYIDLRKIDHAIRLIVRDTGIGISKEDLPNVFKRFYRIKNHDNEKITGTGLGLAICKKIVEKHNGTIEVESKAGEGTTFTIMFPRAEQ